MTQHVDPAPGPPSGRSTEPDFNPYAPPSATLTLRAPRTSDDAESIRRELLKHETSIKAIGTLYYLNFALAAVGAIAMLVVAVTQQDGVMAVVVLLYAFLAWLTFFIGRGLRRLERRIRTPVTILSAIGLIGFPIGTLISAYILYLVHSDKGKRVLTPEYQAIVARTPHIKYRTPVWLAVVALLLIALVVAAVVAVFMS